MKRDGGVRHMCLHFLLFLLLVLLFLPFLWVPVLVTAVPGAGVGMVAGTVFSCSPFRMLGRC